MDFIKRLSEKKGLAMACKCFDHPLFILFCGAIATLFYMLNIPVWTLVIFASCGCFIFLFCRDTRPAIPLVLFVVISLRFMHDRAPYKSKTAFAVYGIFGSLILLTALYRLLKRRVEWKCKGGLLGISLFSAAVLFGGVFTEYYSVNNFVNAIMIAFTLFISYAFFAFTLEKREDNLLYVARTCAVAICMIALQLVEIYLRCYEKGMPLDGGWKYYVVFGWAISNMGAEMIAFLLPSVFYLIYKERFGPLYYFIVVIGLVAVYFTLGRNGLLWGTGATILGIFASCFVGRHKAINRIFALALLLGGAIAFAYLFRSDSMKNITAFFKQTGLDDRGRFEVWEGYWNLFLQSPVHGVGHRTYAVYSIDVGKAHNNILQMLGGSGLIGLLLYGVHRVQTVWSVAKKPTAGRLFMSGCILVGIAMGMISSTFFHVYFLMYYSIILLVLEKD